MVERARRARQTKLLSVLLPMAATEALLSGEVVAARRWWLEGLRLARTLPTSPIAGHNLLGSVVMARAYRRPHEAAQLHGRDRKSTRLNNSHSCETRMPDSA